MAACCGASQPEKVTLGGTRAAPQIDTNLKIKSLLVRRGFHLLISQFWRSFQLDSAWPWFSYELAVRGRRSLPNSRLFVGAYNNGAHGFAFAPVKGSDSSEKSVTPLNTGTYSLAHQSAPEQQVCSLQRSSQRPNLSVEAQDDDANRDRCARSRQAHGNSPSTVQKTEHKIDPPKLQRKMDGDDRTSI